MSSRAQKFVRRIYEAARNLGLADPQARLAASQAALETGYGKSVKGNNYFGIKAGRSWDGPTQDFRTWENVGGRRVNITDRFRKYDSPEDSLLDWVETMERRWPEAMRADTFEDAVEGTRYGRSGGYASDDDYGTKLASIERRIGDAFDPFNPGLAQYVEATEDAGRVQPLDVDTSPMALANTLTLPGIDGMRMAQARQVASPPMENPFNRSFPDNAVGALADRDTGQPLPRTVQAMLSGAPQGSFIPGGPAERALGLTGRPPATPAPRTAVARGPDLPAMTASRAEPRISNVANARVSNAFGDIGRAQASVSANNMPMAAQAIVPSPRMRAIASPDRLQSPFSAVREANAPNRIANAFGAVSDVNTPSMAGAYGGVPSPDQSMTDEAAAPATTPGGFTGPQAPLPVLDAPVTVASPPPVASVTPTLPDVPVPMPNPMRTGIAPQRGLLDRIRPQSLPAIAGTLAGGVIAGPIGAVAGRVAGGGVNALMQNAPQMISPSWGMQSYNATPQGRAVQAGTAGGGFNTADYQRGYAQAGGSRDPHSYSRALAEEQRQRSRAGQKTVGDAFGGWFR